MALSFAALIFLIIVLLFVVISVFTGTSNQGDIVRDRLDSIEKGAAFTKTRLNSDWFVTIC